MVLVVGFFFFFLVGRVGDVAVERDAGAAGGSADAAAGVAADEALAADGGTALLRGAGNQGRADLSEGRVGDGLDPGGLLGGQGRGAEGHGGEEGELADGDHFDCLVLVLCGGCVV